ncbi:MAG: rRNA maturation RNase YbeY [Armatimonadota bacterium]|nr:MAG: rRNA maturation RNase YbeY [Armatimonadota bacterium]
MAIVITIRRAQSANRDVLRLAARAALRDEGIPRSAELSILITDDEEVRRLNREYRGVDAATDVLAFPQADAPEDPRPPCDEPRASSRWAEEPQLLGDVVISAERARLQARERHASFDEELALLAIHGTLHLVGWRDDRNEERERMVRRGQEIWRRAKNANARSNG